MQIATIVNDLSELDIDAVIVAQEGQLVQCQEELEL